MKSADPLYKESYQMSKEVIFSQLLNGKGIESSSWYMKRKNTRRIWLWCKIWAQNHVWCQVVCYSGCVSWCWRGIGNRRIFVRTEVLWRREMETGSHTHLTPSRIREYSEVDTVQFVCITLQSCPVAWLLTTFFCAIQCSPYCANILL